MIQSLMEFLIESGADAEAILQAGRYYLAERTNDRLPEEMKEDVRARVGDSDALDTVQGSLAADLAVTEAAVLAFLSAAWEEPGEEERIRGAVEDAKTKLPVLEAGILAVVAIYGMYLLATEGLKRTERIVKRAPDGTLEVREITEYGDVSGPLSTLAKLLGSSA